MKTTLVALILGAASTAVPLPKPPEAAFTPSEHRRILVEQDEFYHAQLMSCEDAARDARRKLNNVLDRRRS